MDDPQCKLIGGIIVHRILLFLAVVGLLLSAPSLVGQPKKKIPEGMKKKKFHDQLYLLYPDEKTWKDQGKAGLGIQYKGEGVVLIVYRQFFETPGGQAQKVLKINERKVKPTNTTKLAKEFQKQYYTDFKKVWKAGKNKKFNCKAGKGVYCDNVVTKGESTTGIKLLEMFTGLAASADASRSYDPRKVKMFIRPVFIKAKEGVHYLSVMSSEDCMKNHKKEINKLLKKFTEE